MGNTIVAGDTPQSAFDWNVFSNVTDKLTGAFGNLWGTITGETNTTSTKVPTTGSSALTDYKPLMIGAAAIIGGAIVLKVVLK